MTRGTQEIFQNKWKLVLRARSVKSNLTGPPGSLGLFAKPFRSATQIRSSELVRETNPRA